jgi:hypothetical protein
MKHFFQDLGARTGVQIREITSASAAKAEATLLQALEHEQPVMLGGDMGFLPWLHFPAGYHFGGHTVLASDMEPQTAGLKKGLYAPISLEQLRKARSSPFKPFPPKNLRMEFDFAGFRTPGAKEIASSIEQTIDASLNPPIKNFGVEGLRHTATQILKWPALFKDGELRMNLFNLYVFIEIGGTGGGCFRYMYSRFLTEAATITGKSALAKAATMFDQSGKKFCKVGQMFKNADRMDDVEKKIHAASRLFLDIAEHEEEAFRFLKQSL